MSNLCIRLDASVGSEEKALEAIIEAHTFSKVNHINVVLMLKRVGEAANIAVKIKLNSTVEDVMSKYLDDHIQYTSTLGGIV